MKKFLLIAGFACLGQAYAAQAQTVKVKTKTKPAKAVSVPAPTATPAAAATATPTAAAAAGQAPLTDYVGVYKMQGMPFETLEFTMKAGQLTILANGDEGPVAPVKDDLDAFTDPGGIMVVHFKRDASKKVVGITMEAQGYTFEGTK